MCGTTFGHGGTGSPGAVAWVLVGVLLVAGCGDAPPDDRAAPDSPGPRPDSLTLPADSSPAPPGSTTPSAEAQSPGTDSLRAALERLVAGTPGEERPSGTHSWFSEETRGVLRAVELEAGRAVVDFDQGLPGLIPGANSSAGSDMLLSALDSTVFQFPWVDSVEYRLGGSCPAFWEWLQRECVMVTR